MFDDLLILESILGVVQFDDIPFFGTMSQHTFVYTPHVLVVSSFVQGNGLWDWLPLTEGGQVDEDLLNRVVPCLSRKVHRFQRLAMSRYGVADRCPSEINSWDKVVSLARNAPSCCPPILDGVTYRHEVFDRLTSLAVTWSNPQPREHSMQTLLVSTYSQLLAAANLTPELVQEATGRQANPPQPIEYSDGDADDVDVSRGKKRSKPWQHHRP